MNKNSLLCVDIVTLLLKDKLPQPGKTYKGTLSVEDLGNTHEATFVEEEQPEDEASEPCPRNAWCIITTAHCSKGNSTRHAMVMHLTLSLPCLHGDVISAAAQYCKAMQCLVEEKMNQHLVLTFQLFQLFQLFQ